MSSQIDQNLHEHISYELLMLRYTLNKCRDRLGQLEWNAHFESFAVHARILYLFLTNGDSSNLQARQFIKQFEADKTNVTVSMFQKLRAQVFHLAKRRPADYPDKATLANATDVAGWIEVNFKTFIDQLPEKFRSQWNWDAVDPAKNAYSPVSPMDSTVTTARSVIVGISSLNNR